MKGQVPIYGSAGTLKQGWKRRQVSLLEDCGNFLIQMRRQMTFWGQNSASRSLCLLKASLYALKQCGLWGGDPLLPHINMKQKIIQKAITKSYLSDMLVPALIIMHKTKIRQFEAHEHIF